MNTYNLEATKNTPQVIIDPASGKFSISGKSYPENSKRFYSPITEWVLKQKFPENTVLDFYFIYVSSSSVISILDLIRKISAQNNSVVIKWTYEAGDDDMKNVGHNFQKLCPLKFDFVEVE